MSRSSKKSDTVPTKFASEAEAAEWFDSGAGRRHAATVLSRAVRTGSTKMRKGLPSAAELKAMVEESRLASTKPISLRIPQRDLEIAKRIAAKKGIGYQTVLKEAIHAGLDRTRALRVGDTRAEHQSNT